MSINPKIGTKLELKIGKKQKDTKRMILKNRKRKELDLEIGKEKKEKNGSTLGQEHEMDTKSK